MRNELEEWNIQKTSNGERPFRLESSLFSRIFASGRVTSIKKEREWVREKERNLIYIIHTRVTAYPRWPLRFICAAVATRSAKSKNRANWPKLEVPWTHTHIFAAWAERFHCTRHTAIYYNYYYSLLIIQPNWKPKRLDENVLARGDNGRLIEKPDHVLNAYAVILLHPIIIKTVM